MHKDLTEENPSFEEIGRDLEPALLVAVMLLLIYGAEYLLEQLFGGPAWLTWASATLLVIAGVISYLFYALDGILRHYCMIDDEE